MEPPPNSDPLLHWGHYGTIRGVPFFLDPLRGPGLEVRGAGLKVQDVLGLYTPPN